MMDKNLGAAGRRPGSWLRIATPEPGFADCVAADVSRIARSKAGRALLEQIRDSGRNITVEKPGAIDPPNAWVQPRDLAAATEGAGSDCAVIYDPRSWPNKVHDAVASSDVLLFNLLRHALAHLRGAAGQSRDGDGGIGLARLVDMTDYRREASDDRA